MIRAYPLSIPPKVTIRDAVRYCGGLRAVLSHRAPRDRLLIEAIETSRSTNSDSQTVKDGGYRQIDSPEEMQKDREHRLYILVMLYHAIRVNHTHHSHI